MRRHGRFPIIMLAAMLVLFSAAFAMPAGTASSAQGHSPSARTKCTVKLVTKKVHGKRKKVRVRVCTKVRTRTKASATAVPSSTATVTPTSTTVPTVVPTVTATPSPTATSTTVATIPLTLNGFDFFGQVAADGSPVGTPQTSFPDTTSTIYAYAFYDNWQGYHEVAFKWYDPSGNLYSSNTDKSTDNGPTADRDWIDVAGHQAASLHGQWTLDLFIDGVQITSQNFTIYAGSTPPPAGAISLRSLAFYSDFSNGYPTGPARTSFPSDVPFVVAFATYSDWEGYHEVTFNWYDPSGRLYTTASDDTTDSGPTSDYGGIYVAGTDAASLPGTWRVDVIVDGHRATSGTFTITSAGLSGLRDRALMGGPLGRPAAFQGRDHHMYDTTRP